MATGKPVQLLLPFWMLAIIVVVVQSAKEVDEKTLSKRTVTKSKDFFFH